MRKQSREKHDEARKRFTAKRDDTNTARQANARCDVTSSARVGARVLRSPIMEVQCRLCGGSLLGKRQHRLCRKATRGVIRRRAYSSRAARRDHPGAKTFFPDVTDAYMAVRVWSRQASKNLSRFKLRGLYYYGPLRSRQSKGQAVPRAFAGLATTSQSSQKHAPL